MYIANSRETPVPVIDYGLEVSYRNGDKIKLKPNYVATDTLTLVFANGSSLKMPTERQYLLRKANTLITKDRPLMGYVVFPSPPAVEQINTLAIHLMDGYGNTHSLCSPVEDLSELDLLRFLVDGSIRVPHKAIAPGDSIGGQEVVN